MARQRRIDPEGGIHHVFTRGSNRWVLFHDDADRRRFLGTLDRVCDRYRIEVLAYCLMDNHVHLAVRCPDGSLSAAMRDLKSIYAAWFRSRHRSSGPIFESRFGSVLVTDFAQLKRLVRYVHRNPYAISPTLDLAQFPWSSHPMYLGTIPAPKWMNIGVAKSLFTDYRREVEKPDDRDAVQNRPPSATHNLEARRSSVQVPGDTTDCPRTVAVSLENQRPSSFAPGLSAGSPGSCTFRNGVGPGLADIIVAVAHAADVDVSEVHPSRRNGLIGVAVTLAHHDGGFGYSELAQPLGYGTANAARMAMRRTRDRLCDDADLARVLRNARRRLWPKAA